MPLVRSRSHHRGIYQLFQILPGREVPGDSSFFHLVPLIEMFSPAGRLVRLYDAEVFTERRRWEALGVVLVRQFVVVVNVVESTAFHCVHVPSVRLQPASPCLTNLNILTSTHSDFPLLILIKIGLIYNLTAYSVIVSG